MDMLSTAMSKMERPKPTLHLSDKDLPESKDWETGKTYNVTAKIKKVGHSEDMFGGKDKSVSSRFEVHNISSSKDDKDNKKGEGQTDKEY